MSMEIEFRGEGLSYGARSSEEDVVVFRAGRVGVRTGASGKRWSYSVDSLNVPDSVCKQDRAAALAPPRMNTVFNNRHCNF